MIKKIYPMIIFFLIFFSLIAIFIPTTQAAIEDLTTYTEVDALNRFTVNETRVTIANLSRGDDNIYVYYDFEDNPVSNFSVKFEFYTPSTMTLFRSQYFYGLCSGFANSLGDVKAVQTELWAGFYVSGIEGAPLYSMIGNWSVGNENEKVGALLTKNVLYYAYFNRTNDFLEYNIYSDSARTVLVSSQNRTNVSTTVFRYMYVAQSFDFLTYETSYVPSWYNQNYDITAINTTLPLITTETVTFVNSTGAYLNAELERIGTGSSNCTVFFEYGTNITYGTNTTDQNATTLGAYVASITGLINATTYHYRAVAINDYGTAYGDDITFLTEYTPDPPTNASYTVVNGTTVNLSWDRSDNTNTTVVIKKNGMIPISSEDGTVVYNGTDNYTIETIDFGENVYFKAYSFAAEPNNWNHFSTTGINFGIGITYTLDINFVNERTGAVFDWTNAKNNGNMTGCQLTIIETGAVYNLYEDETIYLDYTTSDIETFKINMTYKDTESIIQRLFLTNFFEANSSIGLVENETQFYEQLLYSTSQKAYIIKNSLTQCFIGSGYTKFAYDNYYSASVVTISELYYLYTRDDEGNTVLLASIDGTKATTINLDFLDYNASALDGSLIRNILTISAYTDTTFKIYYYNINNDNDHVEFNIYDNDTLIFTYIEYSNPNEIIIYFNWATLILDGTILEVIVTTTKNDGTTDTITRYINTDKSEALADEDRMPAEVGAILSLGFLVFGLTIISSKHAFGVFGIIVVVIGLGITAFAESTWYILLIQAVEVILLMFIFLVFKEEGVHAV